MASGLQGKAKPAADTWTNIYTVPSSKVLSFSINACNLFEKSVSSSMSANSPAPSKKSGMGAVLEQIIGNPAAIFSNSIMGIFSQEDANKPKSAC
jgi:hypothetical protein